VQNKTCCLTTNWNTLKQFILAIAISTLCLTADAQALAPQRTAVGSVVSSPVDPNGQVEILRPATYVGAVRFVLFGAADCEIHLYVDADASKRVRSVYWIQFEAYLPEPPTFRYSHHPAYSPLTMSGLPVYQRARFGQSSDVPQPGSDADQAFALLRSKGYTLPAETVNVTYKHFLGSDMRKELLLMVIDDMSTTDTTFAELVKDGKLQPAWNPIAEKLLAKASKVFSVRLNSGAPK
jgi:hypothetical protein